MAERDSYIDNPVRLATSFRMAEEAERNQTGRTLPRSRGAGRRGDDSPSSTFSRRRLRHFIDRMFENTMPRTAAGESARLGRNRAEPGWQPAHPRSAIGRSAPAVKGSASADATFGWLDIRFGMAARKISTPRVLSQLFGLIVMLTLIAFGTSSYAISQLRETISTIGLHTKPAIGAAERMRAALGAMDVDAAGDSLLGDAVSTGTSREFAADVGKEIAAMAEASADIRLGDTEAAARIQAMQYDLHLYYAALGEAREAGRSKPWLAAQRVKFASRLLRSHVMAQADAFESSNWQQLEAGYDQSLEQSHSLAVSYLGIGALLIVTLIGAQIFLLRRTRRLINVPLMIATGVLALAVLWVGLSILQERADLQAGKTGALEQLVALRQAKSAAYAINADEAMWLIDHEANRVDYEQDFTLRARQMLDIDPADEAALTALQAHYAATDPAAAPPILPGLLGTVFAQASRANAVRASTGEAIGSFLAFLKIDRNLHGLEDKGDHRGALELRTGAGPDQVLSAFSRMDKALDDAIAVADAEFEQRVSSATAITFWLELITVVPLGLALMLAAAGLWQRYREYR